MSNKDFKPNQRAVRADLQFPKGTVTKENGLTVKRLAVATWDFAVHGGAEGDIGLGVFLPTGAIVVRSWVHSIASSTTSDSGTLAFKAQTAADLFAATAAASLGDHGITDGKVKADLTDAFRTTAQREITATIANNLTAGKVAVYVEYVLAE